MKPGFLILLLILCGIDGYSQNYSEDQRMVGGTFRNRSVIKQKTIGSQYQQPKFVPAKVKNVPNPVWMRYNIFADEFEFITPKNDTLIADKIEDFSAVTLTGSNINYELMPYTNNKNQLVFGYLISLYRKGDLALFKKENVQFVEEKIAKTTLEMNMPAKYVKSKDTYYIKHKDSNASAFPENKKGLIKLYPDKKEAIEKFLKENKVSFDEQNDLIRIVNFLAGL